MRHLDSEAVLRATAEVIRGIAGCESRRGGGRRVECLVGAHERQRDTGRGAGGAQREGRPAQAVEDQVLDTHVGVFGAAESQDRPVGQRTHRDDAGVVGVEDGGAAGCEAAHEFALGPCDGRARAELPDVGLADIEHDRDVGCDQAGEVGDVADVAGAHFEGEETGVRVGAQHGQGHAELVVARTVCGDGRPGARKDHGQQILGAGLAL